MTLNSPYKNRGFFYAKSRIVQQIDPNHEFLAVVGDKFCVREEANKMPPKLLDFTDFDHPNHGQCLVMNLSAHIPIMKVYARL